MFELIIDKFKYLIRKYLNKIDKQDKEDIKQEILIKIYNICLSFEILENISLIENENQFIKYIDVTIRNVYIDYLRTKENKETLIENIDILEDTKKDTLLFEGLREEEIDFLNLFIEEGKLISEQKVGKKLGISQQAVHKKVVKIRNKMKK